MFIIHEFIMDGSTSNSISWSSFSKKDSKIPGTYRFDVFSAVWLLNNNILINKHGPFFLNKKLILSNIFHKDPKKNISKDPSNYGISPMFG